MHDSNWRVALVSAGAELSALKERCDQLGIVEDANARFQFIWNGNMLTLNDIGRPQRVPLSVDFLDSGLLYRLRHGGRYKEAIARAVGLRHNRPLRVLDATAGLGRESFLLSGLGAEVLMIEQNPLISLLLEDGLRRAYQSKVIGAWIRERLSLLTACSIKWMKEASWTGDVIYLDPMFPPRKKRAQVKKELQFLQELVFPEPFFSESNLFAAARAVAQKLSKRVVVKRPHTAGSLSSQAVTGTIKSRSHRFDLYVFY